MVWGRGPWFRILDSRSGSSPLAAPILYPVSLAAENAALSRRRSWVQIPYRMPIMAGWQSDQMHRIANPQNRRFESDPSFQVL